MEHQRAKPERSLYRRVGCKRVDPGAAESAGEQGAGAHAAHEQGKHQHLGVGCVSEEELKVPCPCGFIDQPHQTRERECQIEQGLCPQQDGSARPQCFGNACVNSVEPTTRIMSDSNTRPKVRQSRTSGALRITLRAR